MWFLYASGSALTAALVAIFGKLGLEAVDPTLATIIRGVIMAALLVLAGLALGSFRHFDPNAFTLRAWMFIVLAAAAGAASWVLYFFALRAGPASAVAVVDKFSVILVIVLAASFLGESLTWKSVLGIVFTVAGSLLIIFK